MNKKILISLFAIISCTSIYSQHPGSYGHHNPFEWALIGGLGALISWIVYKSIWFIVGLIFGKKVNESNDSDIQSPVNKENNNAKDSWSIIPKKMGDRYSQLVESLRTFNSNIQIKENTRQDLSLYIPEFNGNGPVDIHIYIIDPNVLISVKAVLEGKETFKMMDFNQYADQQVIFNSLLSDTPLGKFAGERKENSTAAVVLPSINELSQEQCYTLFFLADYFGGGIFNKEFQDEKKRIETQHILSAFQKELGLTDRDVNYLTTGLYNHNTDELFIILSTIKRPSIINSFLNTCVYLIDINTNKTSVKDFFRMMSKLGYQKEAAIEKIKSITFAGNTHFFDQEENDTVPKEKHEETNASSKSLVIINRWPLLDFAREHGPKMQVGEFMNKDNGEEFHACIFTKPDGIRTFVAFSSKLGEITPKEIASLKDQLEVVQLESGNYSLCKKEDNNWEDVDLGLE